MAIQHRTYLDAPSAGFLRTAVILSAVHACTSALAFMSSLIGALFLDYYDNPLRAIIFTLIPLIEATAMIIFIVFFRRDHVRRNAKMFAYPVMLYSLINLLFVIHAHSNWKWDSLVYAITFIFLALVAADCYYGFKRNAISMIALIFTGACQLISIIYALIITTIASPGQVKVAVVAVSFLISLFSTIPYLIMIFYLRERLMINARLAATAKQTEAGTVKFGESVGEFGEKFGEKQTHEKIIALMRLNPKISAKALGEAFNLTTRGIEKSISALKKAGVVERVDVAKGGHWVVKQ